MPRRFAVTASIVALAACNAPEPPASTGGTTMPEGPCGRGMLVVHSGDSSTNVSLVALDGRKLSPSFFSSATSSVGLSAPLSGDVVVPTTRLTGAEVTLIDRYPASVLTWVDVESGEPRAQLQVGSSTNPHDYVALGATKAYVSRFDADDIAIIDPSIPALVGAIDLTPALEGEDPGFRPNPGRMIAVGGRVYVALEALHESFQGSIDSRIVPIDPDTDALGEPLVLHGVHGCSALAVSPDESEIALGCAGTWIGTSDPDPATSFVVRVSIAGELSEIDRRSAADYGQAPFAFGLDYASDGAILALRFGSLDSERPDTLLEIDVATGTGTELVSSGAFELGDVRCAAGCNVCFATDAERGVLHRFDIVEGHAGPVAEVVADDVTGLAPRWLGRF